MKMGEIMESRFRGFEVGNVDFEKESCNCEEIVGDSCNARNCLLNVYHLGEDVVLAGGLCPKGNTGGNGKKINNYTQMYKTWLNNELRNHTVPLEGYDGSERVLIPRSLTFLNEKGVFQAALYKNLGFDVSVSPESNDEIADFGEAFSHPESCYPSKLVHGHSAVLKNNLKSGRDKIFLPDTISVFEDGKRLVFCPYVASAGHVVMGNLRLKEQDVLIPVIKYDDESSPLEKSILSDLERAYGEGRFSRRQVRECIDSAIESQDNFLTDVKNKGQKIFERLVEKGEDVYLGIGRGYTLLDEKASSKVDELFAVNGMHFIPSYLLDTGDENIGDVADNMFWYQGASMIRASMKFLQEDNVHLVRFTNFNCGPDSMVLIHERGFADKAERPRLELETDGHNNNAQFGTRIQAYRVVVEQQPEKEKFPREKFQINRPSRSDLKKRLIGVPYMGASAEILSSSLKVIGYDSELMPTRTDESIELADKFTCTNTCEPFAFQAGDHLAWLHSLEDRGIDANKEAAVLLPKAEGPCRFGQYSVILRKFFDESGFENVPIVDPGSNEDYFFEGFSKKELTTAISVVYRGVFADDVLKNAHLRYRPYEVNPGEVDEMYRRAHNELIEMVERNSSIREMREFMNEKSDEFDDLEICGERKPLAFMCGEIFVRCHEKANQDSVRLLEKNGLEVILDPCFEWMDYVNQIAVRNNWNHGNYVDFARSLIKKLYVSNVKRNLFKPFERHLKGREFHDPFHLIKVLEDDFLFSSSIQGESVLNVGNANSFAKGEMPVNGIYHVGPFGCMQETVASSRIQSLLMDKRESARDSSEKVIPFMDAVFGESELTNLEAQVALFAENCRVHKELNG